MKKIVLFPALALLIAAAGTSCQEDNNDNGGTLPGQEYTIGEGSDDYEIDGNVTLTYPNKYTLKGFVYVPNGATLTIEPGVVIKGDKATKATIIVEPGGKLIADGTQERPIVFTSAQPAGSRKPGDWGGIILMGNARNNQGEMSIEGGVRGTHGGNNDADNSGVLRYVRCEYAGIEYTTDNEINAITFGSVGSGTTVDYVQVSYSGDDAFEWFGGTVNCKHMVALGTWDDDFDTDNGFSGKVQYAVVLRDPLTGDKSASNGFESDNNSDGAAMEPYTSCVFSNFSVFGPVTNPASYTNQAGINGSPVDARFQAAMHLRRNTELRVFNSLFAAFPIGLIIENDKGSTTQQHATDGVLQVTNCVMAGMIKNFQDAQYWSNNSQLNDSDPGTFADSYFNRNGGNNRTFATVDELALQGSPFNLTSFCMIPGSNSPLANGASWEHPYVSSGFDQVSYIGAFSPNETVADNWMSGWTNFDPQNTIY